MLFCLLQSRTHWPSTLSVSSTAIPGRPFCLWPSLGVSGLFHGDQVAGVDQWPAHSQCCVSVSCILLVLVLVILSKRTVWSEIQKLPSGRGDDLRPSLDLLFPRLQSAAPRLTLIQFLLFTEVNRLLVHSFTLSLIYCFLMEEAHSRRTPLRWRVPLYCSIRTEVSSPQFFLRSGWG